LYAEGHVDPDDPVVRDGRQVWREHRVFRPAPSARRPRQIESGVEDDEEEVEEETPQLNKWVALALLVVATVLIAGPSGLFLPPRPG
jgi:hypothetical protein